MASKDKKKKKARAEVITLTELPEAAGTEAAPQTWAYEVKIIPAPAPRQRAAKYEAEITVLLNEAGGEGGELLCVLPAEDSKKFVAFFKFRQLSQ
jgi:hypothetical protein